MARLINGGIFGEMRGSIGGVTFTKNAGGEVVRRRVIPVNRNTPAQQVIRQIFTASSQIWSNLDAAKKDSWESPPLGNYTGGVPPLENPMSPVGRSGSGTGTSASVTEINGSAGKAAFMQHYVSTSRFIQVASDVYANGSNYTLVQTRPAGVITSASWFDYPLSLGTIVATASTSMMSIMSLGGTPATTTQNGTQTGIAVYCSNPLPYIGARSNTRPSVLLGALKPGARVVTAGVVNLNVSNLGNTNVNLAQPLVAGQVREFFVYLTDIYGSKKLIGRRQINVT